MKDTLGNKRNAVKIFLDIIAIGVAVLLAFFLKEGSIDFNVSKGEILAIYMTYGIIYTVTNFISRNTAMSWSYIDSMDVVKVLVLNMMTLLLTIAIFIVLSKNRSWELMLMIFIFTAVIQLLMRMFFRLNREYQHGTLAKEKKEGKRTLIYGAGEAGVTLVRESKINKNFAYDILGLIDDDKKKAGVYINGVKVYGNKKAIKHCVHKLKIEVLIIAMPSLAAENLREIFKEMESLTHIEIKILPLIQNSLSDEPLVNQIRNVKIEDLLGRAEVKVNDENVAPFITGKTILVTGGGGSIGSELSRQLSKYKPKKLINIDVNENSLYLLELEIKRAHPDLDLVSEICSIRDREKLDYVFSKYRPEVVFHAAAHKHVPLMERSPEEAIKNNIFGTKNLVDTADKYKVDRFVMISTDKAVNPTNVMGASKRACELIVENKNEESNTKFMAVRFGNVLGSNGSVIPIFRKLLEEGRNLTVTHKDMTRYFMTIPEAAQLVIEAGTLGSGGEVFILDMGEPVKIMDLAKNMIRFSNSKVGIDVVGLRPGEKLYEELLYDVNSATKTENKKIFITTIEKEDIDISYYLKKLKELVDNKAGIDEIKKIMKEFITSYKEVKYE